MCSVFICMIIHDNVKTVQTLFRQCSECSDPVQIIFRIFRICSKFSDNIQNVRTLCVHTFSEFLTQKLIYSEFLDFVANSIYQSYYFLHGQWLKVKGMYVSKTFTAEYHYLKQRNSTFFNHIFISESHYSH